MRTAHTHSHNNNTQLNHTTQLHNTTRIPRQFEGDNGDDRYRLAEAKFPATTALTSLPCGVCPVADQCRDGGPISPQTCAYMDKWLEF